MRKFSSPLLTSLSFFCLLASSAWASGGIKHPSDYGDPSSGISFTPCGSQTVDNVVADCFEGTGGNPDDFLFTLALQTPTALTSITSATFTDADVPTDFGLVESQTAGDCAKMNVTCTPAQITITNNPSLAFPMTLDFGSFAGDLAATVYFTLPDGATAPTFTAAQTSSSVATPEPSEIGLVIAAFGCLIAVRRRQQQKQNG
jgi:hypothetical protein